MENEEYWKEIEYSVQKGMDELDVCPHCDGRGVFWGTPCGCVEKSQGVENWRLMYLELCYKVANSHRTSYELYREVEPYAAIYRDEVLNDNPDDGDSSR